MSAYFGKGDRYPVRTRNISLKAKEITEATAKAQNMATTAASAKATTTKATKKATSKASSKGTAKAPANAPKKKAVSKTVHPGAKPTGVKKSTPKQSTKKTSTARGKGKAAATAAAIAKAPASTKKSSAKAPAKATPKASTKAPQKAPAKAPRKRNAANDGENQPEAPPAKKARVTKQPVAKPKIVINQAPTQRLDVFVCGEGSSGELGLGTAKSAIDVKRPRLNPLLSAKDVGVVHIAAGGMHVAALTHDNKILTWGVNDSGALGRDTKWDGGLKDMDDNKSDDSDDSDSGLNPKESTPTQVPAANFPKDTVFVKLSAGDSHTLALTDDGFVYGWGVFRQLDGILGFLPGEDFKKVVPNPVLLPNLKNIVDICSGSNHALAIDTKGQIFAWGAGELNQLGYHIVQRIATEQGTCLKPEPLRTRLRSYKAIYTGADHSFAIDKKDRVWAWGLNSFGGCGIEEGAGDDNAVVYTPQVVTNLRLENDSIIHIEGGNHHSIAVTAKGKTLTWGKVDGCQVGLDLTTVPSTSIIADDKGKPRILIVPTELPNIGSAIWAAAGSDHSIVINDQGKAYSWGLSVTFQTGLATIDDVKLPTHIDNTALRGKPLNWAGCGGQYSILTAPAPGGVLVNGDNGGEGPSGS